VGDEADAVPDDVACLGGQIERPLIDREGR
jgi:hypothetical protein